MPKLFMQSVEVRSGQVVVTNLVIGSREVAGFLERVSEDERAKKLVDATEVGVACLERATATLNLDFLRQQCEQQFHLLAGEVASIPAKIQDELLKKVGIGEGQVLAPLAAFVSATDRIVRERMESVKTLFDGRLDPDRSDTTLGRALRSLKELLDPAHDSSVQRAFVTALESIAADDSAFVGAVKQLIGLEIKPLRDDLNRLAEDWGAKQAVAIALAATAAKGAVFEEELLPTIHCWAKYAGAVVEHVGADSEPGDIVVTLMDSSLPVEPFRIVVEARDECTRRGRKQISDDIDCAMARRQAQFGLYISKTHAGLAQEVGDWTEGECAQGRFIACSAEHTTMGLRFAVVQTRTIALLASRPQTDVTAIGSQLQRIRTALRRVKTIKTKVGGIRKYADGVTREADELRREIDDGLTNMEEMTRRPALIQTCGTDG
jgi:hypothetical protein